MATELTPQQVFHVRRGLAVLLLEKFKGEPNGYIKRKPELNG